MTQKTPSTIVWIRQDLRIQDNPALQYAIELGKPILPVFIWDADIPWAPGAASRCWLHHALADFSAQLKKHGLPLILKRGSARDVLDELVRETGAQALVWNRTYEPASIEASSRIKETFLAKGLEVKSFNAGLLFEPHEIKNKSGTPFKVFTPFWKHCSALTTPQPLITDTENILAPTKDQIPPSLSLEELELLPSRDWHATMMDYWEPTRSGCDQRLKSFLANSLKDYKTDRDFPSLDATSKMSPYLHFGQISPRQIFAAADNAPDGGTKGAIHFRSEIGWREFAHHLLFHFPHTTEQPLREEFNNFPWHSDEELLIRWQKGQTGFPIVDAAMRQLYETGWMHNRLRMIVGSILVKNLRHHWLEGARWFWDTLVDADLASNTLGWQWIGGCGADAAPYFRIFNPYLQSQKFDPEGTFIRQYVPEIARLPDKYIHQPETAPNGILISNNITLGETYPLPMVDLKQTRDAALVAYEKMKVFSKKA